MSSTVNGTTRRSLIRQFLNNKPLDKPNEELHSGIQWTSTKPFIIPADTIDSSWHVVPRDIGDKSANVTEKMDVAIHKQPTSLITIPHQVKSAIMHNDNVVQKEVLSATTNMIDKCSNSKNSKKRTALDIGLRDVSIQVKKICLLNPVTCQPLGVKWDRNSCAYDAILGILFNVWNEDHIAQSRLFRKFCTLGPRLNAHFSKIKKKKTGFGSERNLIRKHIAHLMGNKHVYGYNSLYDILYYVFLGNTVFTVTKVQCNKCSFRRRTQKGMSTFVETSITNAVFSYFSTSDELLSQHTSYKVSLTTLLHISLRCSCLYGECQKCNTNCVAETTYTRAPPFLCLPIPTEIHQYIQVEGTIRTDIFDENLHSYKLKGLIYFGHSHYTCRYIDCNGYVWYSDGLFANGIFTNEGHMSNFHNSEFLTCRTRSLNAVIYLADSIKLK